MRANLYGRHRVQRARSAAWRHGIQAPDRAFSGEADTWRRNNLAASADCVDPRLGPDVVPQARLRHDVGMTDLRCWCQWGSAGCQRRLLT